MPLYVRPERIRDEIAEMGRDPDGPLEPELLFRYDQYHYDGVRAVDAVVRRLGLSAGQRVLEVGSGIGGPARRMASAHGLRVTALELQPDLHALASSLTRQCGLAPLVDHRLGNVLDGAPEPGSHDAVVSFLVFLHIPRRAELLARCREALVPGGRLGVEDYVRLRPLEAAEAQALAVKVQCPWLPEADEYRAQLEAAGFAGVELEDLTSFWRQNTAGRRDSFLAARERNVRVHGEAVTDGLEDFYGTVAGLFAAGAVGGRRITARRA